MNEKKYSLANDVYAFGMIIYLIITEENPYIQKSNINNILPKIKESTPKCIKELILKCWSFDPKERPTFDQICCEIKTNPDFIFDEVNKEEYQNYVDFIQQAQKNYVENKAILTYEDFMKTKKQTFHKVKINLNKLKDWKRLIFSVKLKSINLNEYIKPKKIGSGGFGDVYIVNNIKTNDLYAAKVSKYEMDQCSEDVVYFVKIIVLFYSKI